MAKRRVRPPAAVWERVLREFRRRCALCGGEPVEAHHIDEDPGHNDPLNLIPLCPTCHSLQHEAGRAIGCEKLRLFRCRKLRAILDPRFHPLFLRLRLLEAVEPGTDTAAIAAGVLELVGLMRGLRQGQLYADLVDELLRRPTYLDFSGLGEPGWRLCCSGQDEPYYEQVRRVRGRVLELVLELLAYQEWQLV
jgi:hypothetical protein